jgi:hypothetical protein
MAWREGNGQCRRSFKAALVCLGKLAVRIKLDSFRPEPFDGLGKGQKAVLFGLIAVPWIADFGAPYTIIEPADLAVDLAVVQVF